MCRAEERERAGQTEILCNLQASAGWGGHHFGRSFGGSDEAVALRGENRGAAHLGGEVRPTRPEQNPVGRHSSILIRVRLCLHTLRVFAFNSKLEMKKRRKDKSLFCF